MRLGFAAGALALAAVVGFVSSAASAQPVVVADYQDDFQTAGSGWSYLYNLRGPVGNPANYAPLGAGVDNIAVGRSPEDPVAFPPGSPFGPYPQTFVRPGLGFAQEPGGFERAAIAAYTFQPQDILAAGGTAGGRVNAFITAYDFAVSTTSVDGMTARVYHNTDPAPIINFSNDSVPPFPFPPGFRFETALDPRPIPLGTYAAGETVYVAIGANGLDTGDELRLDFTLSATAVPEPTALMGLAALAAAALMRRRNLLTARSCTSPASPR
jgi:hypothetical protein